MSRILVTGASSGLGAAIVAALTRDLHHVVCFDIQEDQRDDVRNPSFSLEMSHLDVLINCAGINRINYLEDVEEKECDEVMDINAKGIFNMTKLCLPLLKASKGTILNIVSNASHMPMTGSLAYNASKGAAHIMTLQLARELTKRHGITVFGISPNKLRDTGMSADIDRQVCATRGWTPEYAKEYQLKSLLTGEETPPVVLADFIAYLLGHKNRHKYLTGTVIPYGN